MEYRNAEIPQASDALQGLVFQQQGFISELSHCVWEDIESWASSFWWSQNRNVQWQLRKCHCWQRCPASLLSEPGSVLDHLSTF